MTKFSGISVLLLAPMAVACGSADSSALFDRTGNVGAAGGFPNGIAGTGGGTSINPGGGTAGDTLIGNLGSGGSSSGGADPFGSGGDDNGNGGTAGTGGTSQGSGASLGAGGMGPPPNLTGCDLSGTWASYTIQPVTWVASVVLLAGQGPIEQWNLTTQTAIPGTVNYAATNIPCGLTTPDLQTNFFQLGTKFGIRFPDSLFDGGGIAPSNFVIRGGVNGTSLGFTTDPFAILIGATLDNATTVPWPAATSIQATDDDRNKDPGVTVTAASGTGYSEFPGSSDPFDTDRAGFLFVAERTVLSLQGTVDDCDHEHASAIITTVGGKAGIDSTVIGCRKDKGDLCTPDDASFIDSNRPAFTPSGPGTMKLVRVANGATCKDVRNLFPAQ